MKGVVIRQFVLELVSQGQGLIGNERKIKEGDWVNSLDTTKALSLGKLSWNLSRNFFELLRIVTCACPAMNLPRDVF